MSRSLVKRLQGQLLDATKAFSGRYTLAGLQKLIVQQTRIWHPRILAVLPYRLVRKDQLDFPAFGLEAFRRALRQPVPTELASLSNLLLEQQVFRPPNTPAKKGATSKVIEDRLALYQQAYHRERLEFLGDRVLGLVAASACQLLAPMRPLATADSTPPLAWEQATFTDLASNALAARFARRFDFGARCQDPQMTDRHLADRWEAYLGALYVARGLQAVLEFLAPLLRERVGVLHGSTGTVPPVSLPELERVEGALFSICDP
ncbi:hypothetical protein BCR35DRAFT_63874 [Leucosporidium creatinivorum]|uniref:RNase III domain-containing protein n=1 Tax=Leucosporidium creatinivorum TaxID=106004 RepID=A0A1Y2FHR2_9BASI|nr:hypothetical protein BCR35DRAFT_63874 [Leucosporidium creatinivorum]